MRRRLMSMALTLLAVVSLASCHYKDFDEDFLDSAPVRIVADWQGADFRPGLRLVICPLDGQFSRPYIVDMRDSATLSLPVGRYRIVAFNSSSDILRVTGLDDLSGNVEIHTDPADVSKLACLDTVPHSTLYDYPDRTMAGRTWTATVRKDVPLNRILIPVKEATVPVNIVIRGIRHLEYINTAVFTLDNCNLAYYPAADSVGKSLVTLVSYDSKIDIAHGAVSNSFQTFGFSPKDSHVIWIGLTGEGYGTVLRYDVDPENLSVDGDGNITIHLDTDFDIRTIIPKGSSFTVGVDKWREDSVDIEM